SAALPRVEELIAITGGAIVCRKRLRQSSQPFAHQSIDLLRRQFVAQPLHQLGLAQDLMALSSASNATPRLVSWRLIVPVDAELYIVGKVGAKLQEKRPEVFIDTIKIVVIDHPGGFHDPRIGSPCEPAAATLRTHDPRILLGPLH